MGIDAEIVIKTKTTITQDKLREWSWHICNALGASKFFINRNTGNTVFELTDNYKENLARGKVYFQDGDSIYAEKDETLIRVNMWTRYYGIGYERGDILFICAVAEWCEKNIPDCQVFYGGDSSGVCATPFTEVERKKLRDHLYSTAGRDYFKYENKLSDKLIPDFRKDCKLCIPDQGPSRFGWGSGYAAYYCPGCGHRFTTNDNGVTWTVSDERTLP